MHSNGMDWDRNESLRRHAILNETLRRRAEEYYAARRNPSKDWTKVEAYWPHLAAR